MSVEYSTIAAVGFKVSDEEYKQAMEMYDEDEWDDIYDTYFYELNSWTGGCGYIFSNHVKTVGEGEIISVMDLYNKLNYDNYKPLIDKFNEIFPFVDKETHQLDVLMAILVN